MGSRPIMAGAPTVEINLSRYDELLHAEVKCEQYRKAVAITCPNIVKVIEAPDFEIQEETDCEVENE